ncbi:MAG TPA: hypothetical protein P5235_08030 [Saprospiraceae bacterium]|nr:hypothetical protein [Saprospiraceae bacterium]HPK09481.1 hypothetical protein [Saprospiraceae bacterium]HRX29321.1 hypothetical protein [Saprospiraceae bacterium]
MLIRILILFSIVFYSGICQCQTFLQLNRFANPEPKRFYVGDKLTYKLNSFGDEWFSHTIDDLNLVDSLIIFEQGFIDVSNISELRIYKPVVRGLGAKLIQFGVLWVVYGIIIDLVDNNNPFTIGNASIGLGGMVVGWSMKTFLSKKDYKINEKNRVKLMYLGY